MNKTNVARVANAQAQLRTERDPLGVHPEPEVIGDTLPSVDFTGDS